MKEHLLGLIVLLLAATVPSFAKRVHAPLPPELLAAKTVCISTATDQDLRDKAYEEILKSKHFTFVTDCSSADLVFSFEVHQTGYVGSHTTQTIKSNITPTGTVSHPGYTTYGESFSVTDVKTGKPLWKDSMSLSVWSSAAQDMVKNLIKRIKEQSK